MNRRPSSGVAFLLCLHTLVLREISKVVPGYRSERWTVLSDAGTDRFGGRYVLCRCDCGVEKRVAANNIRRGVTTSCGCYKREKAKSSLTGQRFGRLVVVQEVPRPTGRKTTGIYCLCQCDCGAPQKIYRASELVAGRFLSCRCLQRERLLKANYKGDPFRSARSKVLRGYKNAARNRGFEWNLTDEEATAMFALPCFYCGRTESNACRPQGKSTVTKPFLYNGIDRLDSSKGYSPENCVPCCGIHNVMKMSMSVSDFIEECRRVVSTFDKVPIPLAA